MGICLGTSSIKVYDDTRNVGMVYAADYSTSGSTNPRWIPDWGAVTGYTNYSTGGLTDGAPTASELNTATGTSPASAGSGTTFTVKDTTGTQCAYYVVSDGTSWHYLQMTQAV